LRIASTPRKGKSINIITVGIDLAKNVLAVHGVDEMGKAVLVKPKIARDQLADLIANLPPCLIGMEACSGAHHWARLFRQHGHTVKLMTPKFVTPYRMSGKRGINGVTIFHLLPIVTTQADGTQGLRQQRREIDHVGGVRNAIATPHFRDTASP
jgi:hypothetical protein